MSEADSKTRPYDSSGRREKAEASRRLVLEVAGQLFDEKGYQAATIADIAAGAGVSAETVYGFFGTKAELLGEWFGVVVFGDEVLKVMEQSWVQEMVLSEDFDSAVVLFAAGVRRILERVYPAYSVARAAAKADDRVAIVYQRISDGRLKNLRGLTEVLAAKSQAADQDLDEIAEFMWAVVSPAVYESLTVERGWSGDQYESHLITCAKATFGS